MKLFGDLEWFGFNLEWFKIGILLWVDGNMIDYSVMEE